MIDLIRTLTKSFATPGREDGLRDSIKQLVETYVETVNIDQLGNLICERRTKNLEAPTLLLTTHMDEWGIIITDIDKDGFLRFEPWNNTDPNIMLGHAVRFENGTIGIISSEKSSTKESEISDLFIDIGAQNQKEALSLVSPGDHASYIGELHQNNNRLLGKGLSNTAGCAILIEALKRVPTSSYHLCVAFTVQGGIGARGARAISHKIRPQAAVSVDVTPAGDTPKSEKLPVKLGLGAGIKVMDKTMLATPIIKQHLTNLAIERGIPYQYEIQSRWGTDAGAINLSNGGVASGSISLPIRYPLTPLEMIDTMDLQACFDLTVALLEGDFPHS